MAIAGKKSKVGFNAMRTRARTYWPLFACLCVPFHSSAQTQPSAYSVSVRELSIPPKASHAYEQGIELLARKDAAGSLLNFQRAIAEFPGYYEAYDKIGAAELKLWRIPEAEQAFRKAIELSGGRFAHPLLALAAILDEQRNFEEAESVARRGLELGPDSWTGNYYLGLALFGLNRFEDAEKSAREALHWRGAFPEAYLLLARIHSRQEDYQSLVDDLNEYLKITPDGAAAARAKTLREYAQRMISESQHTTAVVQPQP